MPFFKGAHNFILNGDDSKKHATKEEAAAHASQVASRAMDLASSITGTPGFTSGVQFGSQAISRGAMNGSSYMSTTSGSAAFQGFVSPMSSSELGDLEMQLADMKQQLREKNERKAKKAEEKARNGGRRHSGGRRFGRLPNGGNPNGLPGHGAQPPTGMLPPGMSHIPPMNLSRAPMNIPGAPMNLSGAPMNLAGAPMNISGAPMNLSGAPMNMNGFASPLPPEMQAALADLKASGLPPTPERLNAMYAKAGLPPLPIDPHTGQPMFASPQLGSGIPPFHSFAPPMQNYPGGPPHPMEPPNAAAGQFQPNFAGEGADYSDEEEDAAPWPTRAPLYDEQR